MTLMHLNSTALWSSLIPVLQTVYIFCTLFIAAYSFGYFVLIVQFLLHRRDSLPHDDLKTYPTLLVQLPLYNEKHVVERLLAAVNRLDYPRDRLTVQVLDDSTDDTSVLVAERVAALARRGLNIVHICRPDRTGYKAGALAYGLTLVDAEFVAVFDADFVPPRGFLKRTLPHFLNNPRVGIVQARWGSLNAGESLLTQAQALSIDAHFLIEQTARSRSNFLLTFSGTSGLWRRACIDDAGGWAWDTLTEDLDLSYRAQLKGWQCLCLPDLVVPGEVPPQIDAYRSQQARWSKGTNQVLLKLFPKLWGRELTLMQRLMALHHLGQYLPAPVLLVMFLLTPPLLVNRALSGLPFTSILALVGLAPPLMHVLAQMTLQRRWLRSLRALPVVLLLGSGMVWNNSRAAFAAFGGSLRGRPGEFIRTPKFGRNWASSGYALVRWSAWGELAMLVYALYGVWVALYYAPPVTPYLLLYALSYGLVVYWSARDRWQVVQARRAAPA